MHRFFAPLLVAAAVMAQQPPAQSRTDGPKLKTRTEAPLPGPQTAGPDEKFWIVPAGTKIPLQLRQPIGTKGTQPGDPVYAQTTFPVMIGGKMVIPPGTWVQGTVDSVKRAGRIKGTAELQFHLTTLIYANGYMLDIASAIDRVPGNPDTQMKEPGIIKHEPEKAKDLERVGQAAGTAGEIGMLAGAAASSNIRGLGVGGLAGVAAGTLIGLLARGTDVHFDTGTAVEISLSRPIAVEAEKIQHPGTP